MLIFTWDKNKCVQNIKKHSVSFEEAETAFYDEYSLIMDDTAHSDEEERFVLIGFSARSNLLIVCHCYRVESNEEIIRIISARKATKWETEIYYERK